jgi:hypothetical protein
VLVGEGRIQLFVSDSTRDDVVTCAANGTSIERAMACAASPCFGFSSNEPTIVQ